MVSGAEIHAVLVFSGTNGESSRAWKERTHADTWAGSAGSAWLLGSTRVKGPAAARRGATSAVLQAVHGAAGTAACVLVRYVHLGL